MRIRALSKGNRGQEVKWLKSWLNLLVVPSPKLTLDDRFDDATAAAVLKFKLQNNIVPPNGTADIQVFTTIWLKSDVSLVNTTMAGSRLRFDRQVFLEHFFQSFSEMKENTVSNLLVILSKIEWDTGFQVKHVPWVAYLLATAMWETGMTFAPVAEGGCNDITGCTAIKRRDKQGHVLTDTDGNILYNQRDYGKPRPCPNLETKPPSPCPAAPANDKKTHTYYGRGYVQLTFLDNYKTVSKSLYRKKLVPQEDFLVHYPEKVMDPDIAYTVISVGMRDEGSWFSGGKTFADYITVDQAVAPAARRQEYVNARNLVNARDEHSKPLIADLATKFEALLNISRFDAPHWTTMWPTWD